VTLAVLKMRRALSLTAAAAPLARRASTAAASSAPRLQKLDDAFRTDVERHLLPKFASGKGVVFASAFLATDNIIVHLLHRHFPELLQVRSYGGVMRAATGNAW
jgi:hypothetical protein